MTTRATSMPTVSIPVHIIVLAFVLLAGAVCFPLLSGQIEALIASAGNNVVPYQGEDILYDYVLGLIWALALWVGLIFWPVSKSDKKPLMILWGARIIVALGLSLFYEYKYGLDIDGHFGHAIRPTFGWDALSLFDDGSLNVRRLILLHTKLIPGSYHAAKVGFSFIGLVAVFVFYRAAVLFSQKDDTRILYALGLFPSILFWSCILGKDPIVLFGMALYSYGVIGAYRFRKFKYTLAVIAGIVVIAAIRLWLVPICLVPYLVMQVKIAKKFVPRFFLVTATAGLLIYAVWHLKNAWGIESMSDAVEFRTYASTTFEGGGSSMAMAEVGGGGMLFLPASIFMALFRPLPLEVDSAFGFLQGLDNLILLILFLLAMFRTRLRELFDPIILWVTLLVVGWATVYGMVTYNLGSLARYKLQILPLLLGLLLYLSRRRAVRQRIGSLAS